MERSFLEAIGFSCAGCNYLHDYSSYVRRDLNDSPEGAIEKIAPDAPPGIYRCPRCGADNLVRG